jgi:hypothetical protein
VGRFTVVSPQDVASIHAELQAQLEAGCDETQCIAELGGALGAEFLITGTVGVLGKRQVLTLKLVDIEKVRAVRTASLRADSIEGLLGRLPASVSELLGVASADAAHAGMGTLVVGLAKDSPKGTVRVWADAQFLGQATGKTPLTGKVKAGEVTLTVMGSYGASVVRLEPPRAWKEALIGEVPGAFLVQLPEGERLRFDAVLDRPVSEDTPELQGRRLRQMRLWGPVVGVAGAGLLYVGTGWLRAEDPPLGLVGGIMGTTWGVSGLLVGAMLTISSFRGQP